MKINNDLQTPDDATLVVTRLLNASPELAFEAWTSPAHIEQWMRPEPGMAVQQVFMDLRPGGKFRIQMKMPDGEFFTAVGEFAEVTPPSRLVYTWDWEKDGSGDEFGEVEGQNTRITVDFHRHGDRTEFVLTHTLFATIARRDNHVRGWNTLIESFANALEKN